jgi:hypothetical protein
MTPWEYLRLDLASILTRETEVDVLNQAGEIGWELVAITANNIAVFKRPLPPPAKTRAAAKRTVSTATTSTAQ